LLKNEGKNHFQGKSFYPMGRKLFSFEKVGKIIFQLSAIAFFGPIFVLFLYFSFISFSTSPLSLAFSE